MILHGWDGESWDGCLGVVALTRMEYGFGIQRSDDRASATFLFEAEQEQAGLDCTGSNIVWYYIDDD